MRKRQPNHIICFILTFLLLSMNIQVFAKTVVHVTKVSINKTSDVLIVGKTDTLKATIAPINTTNKAVKWTSSNIHVAKVDSNGKVTTLSIGYANISATSIDGGKINHCTVTVKPTVIATTKNISKLIQYGFTYKSLYGKGTSPDYVFYDYIYPGRPTWHHVNDLTVNLDGNSVCIAFQYWKYLNSKVSYLTQKALNVFLPNGGNQIYNRINQIYNSSTGSEINNETHQISGHKVTISTGAGGNLFVTIYN